MDLVERAPLDRRSTEPTGGVDRPMEGAREHLEGSLTDLHLDVACAIDNLKRVASEDHGRLGGLHTGGMALKEGYLQCRFQHTKALGQCRLGNTAGLGSLAKASSFEGRQKVLEMPGIEKPQHRSQKLSRH